MHTSKLLDNKVSVTLNVHSTDRNHAHLSLDHSYDLLLHDIITTINQFPAKQGPQECKLCPRWQYKDPKKRNVHVFATDELNQLRPLGRIQITKEKEESDLLMDKHQVSRTFHLDFKPEPGKRFMTAEEFHSLYQL